MLHGVEECCSPAQIVVPLYREVGMIKRIHHIGIGVRDLSEAIRFYTDTFGVELVDQVCWPGLKAALFSAGEVILELIEPIEPQSEVAESLERLVNERGGGVHHLCFEVDDIEADVERLREKGVQMIGEAPQQAAGGTIAWLAEKTLDGMMIELCQQGYEVK